MFFPDFDTVYAPEMVIFIHIKLTGYILQMFLCPVREFLRKYVFLLNPWIIRKQINQEVMNN